MPLISVIVPVYNAGDILRSTIDSILAQTFTDFELIIIDDGSTDISPRLCDEYAETDERVKVFHILNGGVCRARNIGISKSNGQYITFCDHDDVYDKDILELEYKIAVNYDCDISVVGAKHIYDNGETKVFSSSFNYTNSDEIKNHFIEIMKSGAIGTVWNILYKKTILEDIRFNESYRKGHEDINFNVDILMNANSIISVDEVKYYHYIRQSMSTSASIHKESLDAVFEINNKIAKILQLSVNSINRYVYINFQGRFLRVCSLICIKTGMNRKEFISTMQSANLFDVDFCGLKWNKLDKNGIIFILLKKKKYGFIYSVLKVLTNIKRKL